MFSDKMARAGRGGVAHHHGTFGALWGAGGARLASPAPHNARKVPYVDVCWFL